MGLLDSTKRALGMGGDGDSAEDIINEIDEEIEQEQQEQEVDEDIEVEDVEEEDDGPEEWDSAYQFATEMLEFRGFSDGQDFVGKVMFKEISKSPMYRDRISSGTQTMSQIANAQSQLQELKGGSDGMNLGEMADKVENANRVIKSVESLEGKEEQMYQEIIGLGQQAVGAMAESRASGRNVESTVEEVDEEL